MFEVFAISVKVVVKFFIGIFKGLYTLIRDILFYKAIKGKNTEKKENNDLN